MGRLHIGSDGASWNPDEGYRTCSVCGGDGCRRPRRQDHVGVPGPRRPLGRGPVRELPRDRPPGTRRGVAGAQHCRSRACCGVSQGASGRPSAPARTVGASARPRGGVLRAAMRLPGGARSWPRFQRAIAPSGIGDACLQRGGPPLAVAGRSQGRGERTREGQGAEGNGVVARGRRSVTNLGRLSQRVTGGCDRFFWLVTRGFFFLSHCHTFS